MIKAVLSLVIFAALPACGEDDGQQQAKPDAAQGSGAACTGALYDPCVAPSDCMSQNCKFYMQSNFTVCTQTCNASSPCPVDSSGLAGQCNNMGLCKPAAPNNCTR